VEVPWSLKLRLVIFCTAVIVALLLSRFYPRLLRAAVRGGQFGLAMLGCCICWMLPQLAITAVRTHGSESNAFERPVDQPSTPHTRIIWILFDELSYDQVFDHRQPGVQLPTFDQLRSESVNFSDIQPVGYRTDQIVPSLFLGRKVDDIRSSVRRDLEIHDAESSTWQPFKQQDTIFADAMQSGWSTGVAGWYNPYCHILQSVLDSCYWQSIAPFPRELHGDQRTIMSAVVFPFDSLYSRFRKSDSRAEVIVKAHTQEYEDLQIAADKLIHNESIRFVFLHIPVPHPEGIYSRKTGQIGVKGSYLDNLVLADKALGDLLAQIRKTAAADQTTIIVSSDHSWRINMWRVDSSWTAEDESACRGKFDTRPVLLIHFPQDHTAELRSEAAPELIEYGIIKAMLRNQVASQGELDGWLTQYEGTFGPFGHKTMEARLH
jgi:hypothetical protein